jgi:hypothetical protein
VSAEYRIRFSEEHLLRSCLRYRQQVWWRRPFHTLKWFLALLLAILLVVCAVNRLVAGAAIVGAILGALLLGWPIDAWILRRRFRKSPFHDEVNVFSLSEEGSHVVGPNSEVRAGWPLFTKARRFKDGLLLFQGPHLFIWLPDDAARDASAVAEAQALARSRIADYRDA